MLIYFCRSLLIAGGYLATAFVVGGLLDVGCAQEDISKTRIPLTIAPGGG